MKGRPRKPAALCDAEGDTRHMGKKKLQQRIQGEIKAPQGLPPCPEHVQGMARRTWEVVADEIAGMGLDRRPDGQMLEGFCVAYGRAVEADRLIARDGLILEVSTIDEDTGQKMILKTIANPAVAISVAAWRQVVAFGAQFGLSPVARTRISIERPDTGEADLMAILSAPREPRKQQVQ